MPTNTIKLHRVLIANPEKVYRAFLDADALVKWLPPNGFTAKSHQLDAKVGGKHKMSFTNFTTGNSHPSAANILNLFLMNEFAIPINSMTLVCPVKCKLP